MLRERFGDDAARVIVATAEKHSGSHAMKGNAGSDPVRLRRRQRSGGGTITEDDPRFDPKSGGNRRQGRPRRFKEGKMPATRSPNKKVPWVGDRSWV